MSEPGEIAEQIKRLVTDALAAEKRGDDAEALRLWKATADSWDLDTGISAKAAARVGSALMEGAPSGFAEGIRYLRRAAEKDVPEALTELGRAYHNGRGVPKDDAEALAYFRGAIELGDENANLDLGLAYLGGQGVATDYDEGAKYLHKAIGSESPQIAGIAAHMLATCYETGKGVPKNLREALRLFRAAEKSGDFGCEDGDRVRGVIQAEKKKTHTPIALWLGLIVTAIAAATASLYLSPERALWLWFMPLGIAQWIAYDRISKSGETAQAALATRFREALQARPMSVRIGGVLWAISEGEFHHVAEDGGSRGLTIKPESTHNERSSREIGALAKRRHTGPYFAAIFALAGLIGATVQFPIVRYLFATLALLGAIYALVREYLYRHGYQRMNCAMVLDPDPMRGRKAELSKQKVHGEARLASETEVLDGASRSPAKAKSLDELEF